MPRIELCALTVLAIAAALPTLASAQSLPFNTTSAISIGFEEKAVRPLFQFIHLGTVRRGTDEVSDPMDRAMDVWAIPIMVPYSVSGKLIPILAVPVLHKRLRFTDATGRHELITSGVGDALVMFKYTWLQRDRLNQTTRAVIVAGVKVPTGSTDERDASGQRLALPLQLGSGSWDLPVTVAGTATRGRFGWTGDLSYRVNTEANDFEAGDVFGYDLALGYRMWPARYETFREKVVNGYLELNGQVAKHGRQDGVEIGDSGGHELFLSPGLQWVPLTNLLVEASAQVPVYQNLLGTQLATDYRVGAGVRYLLPF